MIHYAVSFGPLPSLSKSVYLFIILSNMQEDPANEGPLM